MPASDRPSADFNIYPLSESSVIIEFGNHISEELFRHVSRLNSILNAKPFLGMAVCVPAYCSLAVFYDPVKVLSNTGIAGSSCFEKVSNYLTALKDEALAEIETPAESIHIPVCYGNEYGPDLEDVARLHQLSPDELVHLHSSASYHVYMIGFVPGFAYLGGLPELLNTPRRKVPRQHVPAGSVGLAGMQTGIYPMETPGGWQLIGRTPLQLFSAANTSPSLLKAGDKVKFYPAGPEIFSSKDSSG